MDDDELIKWLNETEGHYVSVYRQAAARLAELREERDRAGNMLNSALGHMEDAQAEVAKLREECEALRASNDDLRRVLHEVHGDPDYRPGD